MFGDVRQIAAIRLVVADGQKRRNARLDVELPDMPSEGAADRGIAVGEYVVMDAEASDECVDLDLPDGDSGRKSQASPEQLGLRHP